MKFRRAVVIAALGAIVALLLGLAAYDQYEHHSNARVAVPKTWDNHTLAVGNARASLRTVWREGRMSYQLRLEPAPAEVAAAIRSTTTVRQHLTLEFLDADGFRLVSVVIEPRALGPVIGPDGAVEAIEARGEREMARDLYRRADQWGIRWSFN